MRKLIVCNLMSLDGFYAAPGKNVLPLFDYRHAYPADERFDAYNAERLRAADTLLLGRSSYELFKGFWPPVADDPNATPAMRAVSQLDNAIEKVVVSDRLTPDQTAPWQDSTRILPRAGAPEQIAALKDRPGKEILVFASRSLWNDLLARGLVDELHLMIAPVVLGEGTPLFSAPPPAPLRLIDAGTWPGSALALVKYAAG